MNKVIPIQPARACGECTACCQGYLYGSAYGHEFSRGKPCYFLADNCSIYPERPKDPCRDFSCVWLANDSLPMWMRPDRSNVIVTKQTYEGIEYHNVLEMDKPITASVLNLLIQFAITNNINLQYYVNGGLNRIGTAEFQEMPVPLVGGGL